MPAKVLEAFFFKKKCNLRFFRDFFLEVVLFTGIFFDALQAKKNQTRRGSNGQMVPSLSLASI